MVLDPDRVVFQALIDIQLEMIVVVIGVAVVLMDEIAAEEMIGQRVLPVVGLDHTGARFLRALHA
jgi:hypothetical protein